MKNNVYKIRVVADTEEDIFIDLMAVKNCTLLNLHKFLLQEFSLDKMEMASFYISNDDWDKGEEITLFNMKVNDEDEDVKSMDDTIIESLLSQKVNKLLYLHDFLNLNIFYIEILNEDYLKTENENIIIVHKLGNYTPKEFNDNISENPLTIESDEIQDIYNEYGEDDEFGGFEELNEDLY
jgi:hypothetical protein